LGRRDVCELRAHHELHPLEERHERSGAARLGVQREGLAVVGADERVLHVALRVQHQHRQRDAGRERLEVLGGERVQPGQPVGALDADHLAVGEVHEAVSGLERPLLAVERPVVRRHRGVDAVAGDRTGQLQQWADGHRHSWQVPNTVR
jgi:hypothetical protein